MKTFNKTATAIALITSIGFPSTGSAQNSPEPAATQNGDAASDFVLSEILVTARKRDERLLDAPLSISAFSTEAVERAGFRSLEDISLATPGLQFSSQAVFNPGREQSAIRFRGLSVGDPSPSVQTGSLFIDGVFVLGNAQSIGIQDLERIEVIRGPQSALFGRNTFAGAINYITTNPSLSSFGAKVDLNLADRGWIDGYVSVDAPIVPDKLALRLSGRYYHRGEQYKANDGGSLGVEETKSATATLFAEPNDDLTLKVRVHYQEDDDGAPAGTYLPGRLYGDGLCAPGATAAYFCGRIPDMDDLGRQVLSTNTNLAPVSFTDAGGNRTVAPDFLRTALLDRPDAERLPELDGYGLARYIFRASLTATYALSDTVDATLVAAHNEFKQNSFRDYDGTDIESWWASDPQEARDQSVEFRLAGSFGERLKWLTGFNYYTQRYTASNAGGALVSTCFNFSGSGSPCQFGPGFFQLPDTDADLVKTYGVFFSASYDITSILNFSVEGRYQNDQTTQGGLKAAYKNFLPRAILRLQPVSTTTLYGSYSRGVLPGRINSAFVSASTSPFSVPYIDVRTGQPSTASERTQLEEALGGDAIEQTGAQTLDAFEIGWKQSALGNRLRLNVAAYYYLWKKQLGRTVAAYFRETSPGSGIPNAFPNTLGFQFQGDSKVWGVEMEAAAVLTPEWSVSGSLSYNGSRFTNLRNSQLTVLAGTDVLNGNRSSRFPEWSGALSSTYEAQFNDEWTWHVRGDMQYQGKTFVDDTNLAYIAPFATVALRAGVRSEGRTIEAYVENLLDNQGWATGNRLNDLSVVGSFNFGAQHGVSVTPILPRRLGMRFIQSF